MRSLEEAADASSVPSDEREPAPDGGRNESHSAGDDRDLFRAVVENVRDYAIFALDPTGHIVSWNRGAEAIKGWRADEVLGRHFSIFYPEHDIRAGKPEEELRVASEQGRFEDEDWRVRRDGSRFWANVVITALRTSDGRLRGFAKVTRDFTERRAAEETARQLVAESAARRVAQEAVVMRDDFLAVAGHELRTPLTALLFHAETLVSGAASLPAAAAARAVKLARSVNRIARLVDELLDSSRIVAGRLELAREEADLAEVTREVVSRNAEPAAQAGSPIRLEAPRPVLGAWDMTRAEQVVEALVANAMKYGRGEPIDVRVEADGGVARVVVRDRGIGIPPEDHGRIFERFERAVSSRNFGGLGLGLWIAKQVVDAHGGRIFVESARGAGATFTVEFPVVAAGEPA